jgi:hypothetical protein
LDSRSRLMPHRRHCDPCLSKSIPNNDFQNCSEVKRSAIAIGMVDREQSKQQVPKSLSSTSKVFRRFIFPQANLVGTETPFVLGGLPCWNRNDHRMAPILAFILREGIVLNDMSHLWEGRPLQKRLQNRQPVQEK